MNTEKITHEQIKELYKTSPGIKDMFPSVFEPKSGWYKSKKSENWLMYIDLESNKIFGFNTFGEWTDAEEPECKIIIGKNEYPASESEVLEALKKEAEKRGYDHVNPNYACVNDPNITFSEVEGEYCFQDNKLWFGKSSHVNCIMKNGVWAEIIPTQKEMTIAEIEKELGYKIKIIGQ